MTDSRSRTISRRNLMRAGAGAGAAAVGLQGVPPRYSPVGRAEALALSTGIAIGVTAAAGVHLANYVVNGDTEVDPDEVVEDQVYNTAVSVSQGREEFISQMTTEYVDSSNAQATPFGRSAWQEIRAAATEKITNGATEQEAIDAAQLALDKAATRAAVNMMERHNTFVNALIEQIVLDYEEDTGVIAMDPGNNNFRPNPIDWSTATSYEAVDIGVPESSSAPNSLLGKRTVDGSVLPVDPAELEGRDESAEVFAVNMDSSGLRPLLPWDVNGTTANNTQHVVTFPEDDINGAQLELLATHSSLDDKVIADYSTLVNIIDRIGEAYDQINSDLSTYVSNLYDGLQQGAIDPSDILSSQDIVDEFADSSDQSRLAAELLAIGAQVPDSAGYQAKVSHPDLQAESLWGWVYPQFTDDASSTTVAPGTTIPSADYNMAYIGYEGAADGSFQTDTLSGDSDLQILDTKGIEGQQELDSKSHGAEAGTDGRVVLWSGSDAPAPITAPGDHSGYQIIVQGATNRHIAPVGDATQNGDQWVLATTSIPSGETIEWIEIVPPANYERSHDYTADPTNVDSAQTLERMENLRQQVDDLEAALNDDGGGGGSLIPDGFSLFGLGGTASAAVVVGGGALIYDRLLGN